MLNGHLYMPLYLCMCLYTQLKEKKKKYTQLRRVIYFYTVGVCNWEWQKASSEFYIPISLPLLLQPFP